MIMAGLVILNEDIVLAILLLCDAFSILKMEQGRSRCLMLFRVILVNTAALNLGFTKDLQPRQDGVKRATSLAYFGHDA